MGAIVNYLARQGIVRVLSVPVVIAVAIWLLYLIAAPKPGDGAGNEADGRER